MNDDDVHDADGEDDDENDDDDDVHDVDGDDGDDDDDDVLLQLQQFPKILKKFGTLLYFELVRFPLVFSLFDFGLWILKRLPEVLVAITHGFSSFK